MHIGSAPDAQQVTESTMRCALGGTSARVGQVSTTTTVVRPIESGRTTTRGERPGERRRRGSDQPARQQFHRRERQCVVPRAIPSERELKAGGLPEGAKPPEKKVYPVRREFLELTPNVELLRATCISRLPEIQFGQKKGTSTNSFLVKSRQLLNPGKDRVLIDLPSDAYDYDLAAWLSELGMMSRLNSVIITRLNPERVPALVSLLRRIKAETNDKVQLYLSKVAMQYVQERSAKDKELKQLLADVAVLNVAGSGASINVGNGEELKFVPIPTARWPDLVAVHYSQDQMLFSSSFFAAHEALDAGVVFDAGGWGEHGDAVGFYYATMLAPAARQVAKALDRLKINEVEVKVANPAIEMMLGPVKGLLKEVNDAVMGADDGVAEPLAVSYIAPIHGPVIRSSVMQTWLKYKEWTEEQVALLDSSSAVVLYASAYGNTASLAQAISRGINKAGVGVVTLNLEQCGAEEVEEAVSKSNGFVIGSPTLGGHLPTQVQTALGTVLRVGTQKPSGVFGSFGWSGEAVDIMEGKLKDAGFPLAFDSIRCKFKPDDQMLYLCEQSGTRLAQQIKKNARMKEKTAAQKMSAAENASGMLLSVGRIIGSLCVLTARDGDVESGMLASWVSQASFDPPGLTVAVKKDRAVESLLPIGARFVLNVLAEGRDRPIMREMVRPRGPAEDRFANLATERSEVSGALILTDSASYLECEVSDRMEAGDHWLVYATIVDGKVLDDVPAAVHFRKVGNSY